MRYVSTLAALLVFASACARKDSSTADTSASGAGSDRTVAAAQISNAIKANPSAADSILKANGYTAESFEREMYDIAADSARSAKYAAAKNQ